MNKDEYTERLHEMGDRLKQTPRLKPWVGLTEDEFDRIVPHLGNAYDVTEYRTFAHDVEAILRSKNK